MEQIKRLWALDNDEQNKYRLRVYYCADCCAYNIGHRRPYHEKADWANEQVKRIGKISQQELADSILITGVQRRQNFNIDSFLVEAELTIIGRISPDKAQQLDLAEKERCNFLVILRDATGKLYRTQHSAFRRFLDSIPTLSIFS
jgi:hypothetical protein